MTISLMRWTSAAIAVVLAWLALMAVVMRFSAATPLAVVLMPGRDFIAHLPPEMAVVSASRLSITVYSGLPDIAARLYAAGALLVLPAGLKGCLGTGPE